MFRRFSMFIATTFCALLLISPIAEAQGRFGGQQGGRGGQRGMMNLGNFNDPQRSAKMSLLQRADVRSHLLVTARQIEKLEALEKKQMEAMQGNFGKMAEKMRELFQNGNIQEMTAEERQEIMGKVRDEVLKTLSMTEEEEDKALAEILKPSQLTRLSELDLQWRGPLALATKKVSEAAGLKKEEKALAEKAMQDYRQGQMEMVQKRMGFGGGGAIPFGNGGGTPPNAGGDNPPADPPANNQPQGRNNPNAGAANMEAMMKEMDKKKEEAAKKLLASLSEATQEKWKTMIGKPFTFRKTEN